MQPWQTTFLGSQGLPRTLTPFELRYFFSFTEAEKQAIRSRRRPLNQLGAALHLGFIKMSGRALDAFDMVPRALLAHLGQELEIPVPTLTSLRALYRRRRTLYEHQRWAADALGFRNLTERQRRVMTGLIKKESHKALTRAQLTTFTRCWCYEHKLLIPGDRALDDFVRKATQQAEQDLLDKIKEAISETLRQDWLLALGSNHSMDRSVLEWLQGEPGKASRATLNRQLAYIDYLKGLSVHEYPLDMLRLEHQKQLAQRIRRRRPARWQKLKEPRRTLESVCFLRVSLLQKTDELISMIERETLKLRRDKIEKVKSAHAKMGVSLREKIQDLHTYAQAPGRTLKEVCGAIAELQPDASIPRFTSQAAEVRYHMTDSAHRVRRYLKALLSLEFEGPRGHLLIAAIASLRALYDKRARHLPQSFDGTFSPIWSAIIEGSDRARALRGFETAILFELRKALRNGSIWVPHSMSYRHREQLLITSRQWRQSKKRYYAHLHLPADPERYVARYKQQLDEGLEQVAEAVRSNHIDIEKDQLVMEALEAEAVSPDLEPTRDAIFGEIGAVQFPELMMEVDSHTRFSSALLGHEPSSWEELLAVYAALLAHGTDMSPTGMALMIPQTSTPAISDRMALLENSAALRLANDSCVAFTLRHPITRTWGEGTMASADSMSLDATRHLFSARQDPRRGRKAIGIYTHKLDQWPLIYDQPIVLMRRQSGAAIEGMLRQRTGEALERIAVDTHGFTFFGMGLSKGLGFDLCPRLKGIKRQLHVPRGTRVPDILEPVVTRDVSMVNIRAGWDGFVRLMASVDAGTLSAVLALDRFGSESRADPIHKCGSAMGQLFLTLFLCDFVGKGDFRRELLRILDRGESTHRLLRAIYAGNIPAHRGRRPEELIAISGSLTLLSNITIAWMTLHMQQVINRWKKEEGRHIDPELLRHIGPARSEGVNFRGKLDFPVGQYQDRLLSKKGRNL